MRKSFITSIIAAAAVLTISSCQMDEVPSVKTNQKSGAYPLKATATIKADTRVSYTLNTEENAIYQQWEVGDVIKCVDNARHMFKFTVDTVVDGVAHLALATEDYDPFVYSESGIKVRMADSIYAIYYSGGSMSSAMPTYNGSDQDWQYRVSFDLTQGFTGTLDPDTTGKKKLRVPLLARTALEGDVVNFEFTPLASIFAVKGFKAAPNAKIKKLTFTGFLSKGNFTYYTSYNTKTYEQYNEYTEFIANGQNEIIFDFEEPLVCNAEGFCDTTLYFPILPAEYAEVTMAATAEDGAVYSDKFSSEFPAGRYIYTTRTLTPMTEGIISVDGKDYFTFSDALAAVNAATEDCEMKLLRDITLEGGEKFFEYNEGRKVTLNLNNYKLSGSIESTSTGSRYNSMITARCNMDIIGGGENGGIENNAGRALSLEGSTVSAPIHMTIDGGTYYTWGTSFALVIGGKDSNQNIAEVTIKNGKFLAPNATRAAVQVGGYNIASSGKLTIENGEFTTAEGSAIRLNGEAAEVTINNGTFSGKHAVLTTRDSHVLTINGGTFESNLETINSGVSKCLYYKININGGYFKSLSDAGNLSKSNDKSIITGGYFTSNSCLFTPADENIYFTVPTGYKYVESDVEGYLYMVVPEN